MIPTLVKTYEKLHRSLTLFRNVCFSDTPQTHLIPTFYALIAEPLQDIKITYQLGWESELDCNFTKEDWSKGFFLAHKSSLSSKSQLSQWYRVSSLLHSLYPTISDCCW